MSKQRSILLISLSALWWYLFLHLFYISVQFCISIWHRLNLLILFPEEFVPWKKQVLGDMTENLLIMVLANSLLFAGAVWLTLVCFKKNEINGNGKQEWSG